MPIFDYECKKCDVTEERLVKSSDALQKCKKCKKKMSRKVSVPGGFHIPGGFGSNVCSTRRKR